MSKVYSHENIAILHSAKNLLALNNINSVVKNEYYASGGHTGLPNIPLELWVQDENDAKRAIAILEKEIINASSKPPWVCQNCGEENDASFELCWQCQTEAVDQG